MMKGVLSAAAVAVAGLAMAQQTGKGNFMAQQAYDETRRLSGQMEIIQNNVSDHASRISKLESKNGNADVVALQSRIAALEATNAELRRKMDNLRSEVTADLSRKIEQIMKSQPKPKPQPVVGPHKEYVVQGGDTLSLIADAFQTKVSVIKEMNGLKNDNLRVGQKLKVPMN